MPALRRPNCCEHPVPVHNGFSGEKDGTLSKKHKKIDNGPVGSTIACCENSENCGTYWEENDFDLENGDKFIDMKYSDEE